MGIPHGTARAEALLERMRRGAASARPVYPDELSEREVEVLRLLAGGKSNPEIAEALVISRRTAEHHVASIYEKIGVEGATARATAAVYAVSHGLATTPPAPAS